MTTLSTLCGVALWNEGVSPFLAVIVSLLVWWLLGLLYEIRGSQ